MREAVVSAQYCSGDDLNGRPRTSRGITWNETIYAFYSGVEDILKQASVRAKLCVDDDFSLDGMRIIAETHPTKNHRHWYSATKPCPVAEDMLV